VLTDGEPEIPEGLEEAVDEPLGLRTDGIGGDDEEIDV
jgi:hypothetical protein